MLRNIAFIFATYILLLAIPATVNAQSAGRNTVQQSSLWIWASANVRLHKNFGFTAESVIRLSEFQRSQQHEFHIGADLYMNEHVIITPGYGYFLNYKYGKLPAAVEQNEHRLWQQIMYRTDIKRMHLNLRLRAEENWRERMLKGTDGSFHQEGYTFRPRIRTRFLLNIALNHKTMAEPKTVFLSVWNETYIALAPKIAYHLPEENRAHIGIGYRPTRWVTLTAGYMHQLLLRNFGAQAESNHTLVVSAAFNVNGVKKKSRKI